MPCSIYQLAEMAALDVPGDQSTVQIALSQGEHLATNSTVIRQRAGESAENSQTNERVELGDDEVIATGAGAREYGMYVCMNK